MVTKRDIIYDRCKRAAKEIGIWSETYRERMDYELKIITDKGFEDYFLILQDIVNWARGEGILVGPGRGSAAGSLVAYLLGITRVDPLIHDLYFERFLNPARPDLPDIDVDFQASRRKEVFQYIKDTYGEDNTCQISTYSRFHIKQVLRDLCRIYEIPMSESLRLSKLIPPTVRTLKEAEEIPEVMTFLKINPEIHELAESIQGAIRQKSVHAAGIVITPGPIWKYMSVEKVKGELCSCFDMKAIDQLGLLKVDVLSLRTLDVIAKAMQLAGIKESDLPADNTDVGFEEEKVYETFRRGKTLGVFQFESSLLTSISKRLQISDFKTLYAATTIARPGPLHSGEAEKYIKRSIGKEEVTYVHPKMEPITEETYGLMLFQEQTMRTARELAGFSGVDAEILRKIIGKSKGTAAIDEYMSKFIDGCIAEWIAKDIAETIWNIIRESGAYSFNKAHAVSYSQISYWCAWLRANYPKEFLTALMIFEEDEMQEKAVRELREMGEEVHTPDLNLSSAQVHIAEDGDIYMGFRDIEGIGEKAVEEIMRYQPYESFDEFLAAVAKRRVNSKVVKNLIQAGVFDKFNRRDILYHTFSDEEYSEWDEKEMITRQNMVLDMPSEKPLIDFYPNRYEQHLDITPMKDIDFSDKVTEVWVKGVITDVVVKERMDAQIIKQTREMAFFDLDDGTRRISCFSAPETFKTFKGLIADAEPVLVKAHSFGSKERLYVDGILSLTTGTNNQTFLNCIKKEKPGWVEGSSGKISLVLSCSYHTSKKGKGYARINLDEEGEWLWFNIDEDPIVPGEVIVWQSTKDPFIEVSERIR